ncbi:hypothetical protein GGF32_004182 [Allomyces javanicus]|nr:hypothetical protein GGF32_004182 [Allomyces javanicus]
MSTTVPAADLPAAEFTLADVTVASIESRVAAMTDSLDAVRDAIAALAPEDRTVESTLLALHAVLDAAAVDQVFATFPSMVHADAEVRSASAAAKTTLKQAFDAAYADTRVYAALEAVEPEVRNRNDAVLSRLYDQTMALHRANGLAIADPEQRAEYTKTRGEIAHLEQKYTQTINEDTTVLEFNGDALRGCSDRYLSGLDRTDDGLYVVTTKAPDYLAVVQTCAVPATRKAMYTAYNARCEANLAVLADMVAGRQKAADLAGYASHAHYRLSFNMAKSPDQLAFLDDLAIKLQPRREADMAQLQALKDADVDAPHGESVQPWDIAYYVAVLKKTQYAIDDDVIAQYFPLERVLNATLAIYATMFDLEFIAAENMPKWHADVRAYTVYRGSTKQLVGHFYLDLHPRPGKYGHQCVVPLMPATLRPDGTHTLPIAANIGNMTKATPGRPALLRFSEARTFFHECGHVMHCLLTQSDHALHAWSWSVNPYPGGVEIDFLELPSQMLENWLYDAQVLAQMTSHVDTGAPLPDAEQKTLAALRRVNGGYGYTRQLFMSLYDLAIHAPGFAEGDRDAIIAKLASTWADLQRNVNGTEMIDGTWPYAAWYHLAGYDAGYYSYLYSEVASHDCFAEVTRRAGPQGCLDPAVSREYAEKILVPGATQSGDAMLRNYLGRELSDVPFLHHVLGDDE